MQWRELNERRDIDQFQMSEGLKRGLFDRKVEGMEDSGAGSG